MNKESRYKIFLSNSLDILKDRLRNACLSSHPMQKNWIILPTKNPIWKDWILRSWMKERPSTGILNLEWMTVKESFCRLKGKNFSKDLTEDGIFFQLFSLFSNLPDLPNLDPLKKYLETSDEIKAHQIKKTLAKLFAIYGLYGVQERKEWKKNAHWQDVLWNALFEKRPFSCPIKMWEEVKKENLYFPSSISIHLFGFSYLPPVFLDMFYLLSKKASLSQYLISPSPFFWQDMPSDLALLKEGFSEASFERHPLLANYLGLSKAFDRALHEYDIPTEESYLETFPKTLLGELQSSFFSASIEKKPLQKDASFQVFSVRGSKLREIEALKDWIYEKKKKDPKLDLEDFLVLAPDISSYSSYISYVFSSSMPFYIEERSAFSESILFRSFFDYIELLQGKMTKKEVLRFLSNKLVQKNYNISQEEGEKLRQYLEKSQVLLGRKKESIKEKIEGENLEPFYERTWEKSLQRLAFSLIYLEGPFLQKPFQQKVDEISFSDRDLLNRFFQFFTHLDQDLLYVKNLHTVSDWSKFFIKSLEKYFAEETEGLFSRKEVLHLLEELEKIPLDHFLSFTEYRLFLLDRLEKKRISEPQKNGNALSFRTFREGALTPVKHLFILGMDEESFPRKERSLPLNRLKTYVPDQIEKDRKLFLDALLFAKKSITISYQSMSLEDGKEKQPSPFLENIRSFFEEEYGVQKKSMIQEVPDVPFDRSLFTEKGPYRSFSSNFFHMNEKKQTISPFIFSFPKERGSLEKILPLKALNSLVKNPIRFFANQTLGVYLEETILKEKELYLHPIDKYQLKIDTIQQGQKALEIAKKKGKMPIGLFEKQAEKTVLEEKRLWDLSMSFWNISSEELFHQPIDLAIPLEDSFVEVEGVIEVVSEKGLWSFQKKSRKELIRMWPKILSYLCHFEKNTCEILFTKKGEPELLYLEVEEPKKAFSALLEYAFLSKKALSPLCHFFAEELLFKDFDRFLKKADKWKEQNEPYLDWFFAKYPQVDWSSVKADWEPYLKKAFSPLIQGVKNAF